MDPHVSPWEVTVRHLHFSDVWTKEVKLLAQDWDPDTKAAQAHSSNGKQELCVYSLSGLTENF